MTDPYLRRPHTESDGGAMLIYMIAGTCACVLLAIAAAVLAQLTH